MRLNGGTVEMKLKLTVDVCALSCASSRFTYRACPTCVRKVFPVRDIAKSNLFWCASCKVQLEEDETNFCYYLTLQVTDGDSVAMATIFGPSLDAVFAMPARLCHAWSTEERCPPLQAAVNRRLANHWLRLYFCVNNPQCVVGGRGQGRKACLRDIREVVGNDRLVAYWLVPIDHMNRFREGGEWSQMGECCHAHQPTAETHSWCQLDMTKEHSTHEGYPPSGGRWACPGYGDTSWQCSQDEAKLSFLDSLSVVLSESAVMGGGATAESMCTHISPISVRPQFQCGSPPTEAVCKLKQEGGRESSITPGASVVQHCQDGLLRHTATGGDSTSGIPCDAESWLSVVEECALTESVLEVLSEPWDTTPIYQEGRDGNCEELPELMENVSMSDSELAQIHQSNSHPINNSGATKCRDSPLHPHCHPPLLHGILATHITTRPHPPATPTTTQPWGEPFSESTVRTIDWCQEEDSPLLFSPTPPTADRCLVTAPPTSATPPRPVHKFTSPQTLFSTSSQDCNTPMNGCATSSHVTTVADTPLNTSQPDHTGMERSPDLFPPTPRHSPTPTTPDTSTSLHATGHSWISPNIL